LKKSASCVLASLNGSVTKTIEASGSSEAWYVPPRELAVVDRGTKRLGASGWGG
jgi:hypothetical protein